MKEFTKVNASLLLLTSILLITILSVRNGDKTTVQTPGSTNINGQVITTETTSETPGKPLEADIQAREKLSRMDGNLPK
jgi:hypothetical protein